MPKSKFSEYAKKLLEMTYRGFKALVQFCYRVARSYYLHNTEAGKKRLKSVNRRVAKGYSEPLYQAKRGEAWCCGTCGQLYTNFGMARNHVRKEKHKSLSTVRI